ncbi:hypothetical protein BPAE_0216g00190 [Botrytis paeoniae]|uniref:Uncharacterized protein n=1 Tax=Botrytis paeoniae TaxID=278948 RepID=A0A4Z1FII6_9HELO|nr:hypothetical protein BPAE_0216g00190 [Botrytis paeoniae]
METAGYIVQFLDSYHWREAWFGHRDYEDYVYFDNSNVKWENENDLGTTIYYASFFELEHVERLLVDEYNATVDVPLELGECPPLSVAIHFENVAHVRHYITVPRGTSKITMFFYGGSLSLMRYYILFRNRWHWLLGVVRSELEIPSEWPLKLGSFPSGIGGILFAIAISMDSTARFQLFLNYIQSFDRPEYPLFSLLTIFAQNDKEAKLRCFIERAATLNLFETNIFQYIIYEVFMRRDEVSLKLRLDFGMHPDHPYDAPKNLQTFINSSPTFDRKHIMKSLLQEAVYRRWRAAIALLIRWGADLNYRVMDPFDITSLAYYSPLKILVAGLKDPAIPSDSSEDSSENDHLIEELLVTGGARIYEYDRKVFSGGSTNGGVFDGSDIEMDE